MSSEPSGSSAHSSPAHTSMGPVSRAHDSTTSSVVLDSYAAKRCPVRVVFDQIPPPGVKPLDVSPAVELRLADGSLFEEQVLSELSNRREVIEVDDPAPTMEAMVAGAPVIAGGHLPNDLERGRSGRPDLLVRADLPDADGRWRYYPVEVKAHRVLRRANGATTYTSALTDLRPRAVIALADVAPIGARHRENGLQLAHYHRMLQALDRASSEALGGVIGRERRLLWLDLQAPDGQRPSLLERYDHLFGQRIDAISAASEGNSLVEPVKIRDCDECPWRDHCLPLLAERRCISTVQGIGYRAWRHYRDRGVSTIEELAALGQPPDPDDYALPAELVSQHIDAARALTIAPGSALLRRQLSSLHVARFDREIDIDMESELGGEAYLWGTYEAATGRATVDADWSPIAPLASARVFVAFWTRINQLRADAAAADQSIGFYCWHDDAEKTALRRGAQAARRVLGHASAPADVEAFLAEGLIIDLCLIAKRDLITGLSKSLKAVAPLAGFSWRDVDPNGATSMVWHANAVDPSRTAADQAQWRQRLIDYNEDDVRAEAAVRHWMRTTEFMSAEATD